MEVTLEQVSRALHEVSKRWLQRNRATTEYANVRHVIGYHQARNRAARLSKQKRVPIERVRKKPRPRRHKRHSRSTVRSV